MDFALELSLFVGFFYLCVNQTLRVKSDHQLVIYNSLSGKKEKFVPLHEDHVGMYVCGPTLYSEPHMGNMRTFINFDFIYRCLLYLGYKVKYVRNITDAGHITNSAGQEVDSIGSAARTAQVQSLEIVYTYNVKFQELQRIYNLLPPSIEPTATAHIQEQIEVIEQIIENGFAYVVNGSVYFDVKTYIQQHNYGALSGRKVDELEQETRTLNAQDEKRFFADFALWKKANPEDMQVWRSPWGNGNPGWHIECTAMSTKYLGKQFDIHGGGLDLKFPHHEALGNYFLPKEIVEGTSTLFTKAYPAAVVRFFMLQAHYRSTLDITEEALNASEKGFERLMEGLSLLEKLTPSSTSSVEVAKVLSAAEAAICDDFNAPILIASLFDAVKYIHAINEGKEHLTQEDLLWFTQAMTTFVQAVLGIEPSKKEENQRLSGVMDMVITLRQQAREQKDWTTSDMIRDGLAKAGIQIKDSKEGTSWS